MVRESTAAGVAGDGAGARAGVVDGAVPEADAKAEAGGKWGSDGAVRVAVEHTSGCRSGTLQVRRGHEIVTPWGRKSSATVLRAASKRPSHPMSGPATLFAPPLPLIPGSTTTCDAAEPDTTSANMQAIAADACDGTATDQTCAHTCLPDFGRGSITCTSDGTYDVVPCVGVPAHVPFSCCT